MLHFFKSNNPSVAAANVILIILYRLVFLFHPVDISALYLHTEPATQIMMRLLYITPQGGAMWLVLGGAILCLIESLLVNRIINRHKVASRKNYIGGVLFVIFTSMIPECMVLGPVLISLLFLLLIFDKLFELSKPDKLYSDIFDLGFLSGLSVLFYFPSLYFLILVYIGFFIMRNGTLKGILIILTGFIGVVALVFTIYFWYDKLELLPLHLSNLANQRPITAAKLNDWQIADIIWLSVLALWTLISVPGMLFSSVIQTRKCVSILLISALLSVAVIPLAFHFDLSHLLFVLASLSIVYAVYFVETKVNIITQILFIVLILSVFVFQYLPLVFHA